MVFISTAFNLFEFSIKTAFFSTVNLQPASSNFDIIGTICSGITFKIFTFPFVIAPAHKKVPASILSGITLYFTDFNSFTPLISITFVPSPEIFAPIFFNIFIISTISGSRAAFVIVVFPSARTVARIIFSVAPTLGKSRSIFAPFILSQLHLINPYSSSIFMPNFLKAFKCKSIGLAPISQPPGYEKLASLNLPIKAPARITVDLISLIR